MDQLVKIEKIDLSALSAESVFQSDFWAEVKSKAWQSFAFAYQIGTHKGTLLVLVRRLFLSFSIAYSPFGLYSEITGEEFSLIAKEIRRYLPKGTFLFRLDPPWNSTSFKKGGHISLSKNSVQPEGTVIIKLPAEFNLKERAKRNLKKEEGVFVRPWDKSKDEFASWYSTYSLTAIRDHFTPRSASYIYSLLTIKDKNVKPILYVAYFKEDLIGGIINLRGKEEEVYLFGSSLKHSANISCGYSLQYYAINKAIEANIKVYDLFGIPSKRGEEHLKSLELFKTSFGGERVYRAESSDYIYNYPLSLSYKAIENFRYYLHRTK